jgi:hypothetical protein
MWGDKGDSERHLQRQSSCSTCYPAHNRAKDGLHRRKCSCGDVTLALSIKTKKDHLPGLLRAAAKGRVVASTSAAAAAGRLRALARNVSDLAAAVALGAG